MGKTRLFIVEDESLIAMELRDRLEHLGYEVCGNAARGEDALEKIPELKPDLVLMDIRLAGRMDGIEAATRLKERINVPIIYLTAYSDPELVERAKLTDSFGYLLKPFNEREISTTLDLALYKFKMEEGLKESENRYRTLFEMAGDGIFILDAEGENAGRIVAANRAAAEMHGYTVEELLTFNIKDLDTPDAAEESPERFRRALGGEHIKAEISHRRKNGTVFPLEISAGLLEIQNHKYLLAFDRDITERKKAEQKIESQVRQLQKLAEMSMKLAGDPVDVFNQIASTIAELLYVPIVCLSEIRDKELYFLSVYNRGEIAANSGSCSLSVTPCAAVEKYKDILVYHDVATKFPEAELLNRHNIISYCGFPALDSSGKVVAVTCLLDDKHHEFSEEDKYLFRIIAQRIGMEIEKQKLSERRRQAEEEREKLLHDLQRTLDKVSESKKEWQETFDSITDLISIHDRDFNIIKANKAFMQYFGVPIKDILNKKCYWLFHCSDEALASCPHRMSMHQHRPVTEEVSEPKTKKIFRVATFPYHSPDGTHTGSIHIARDITEEKERELRQIMTERLASLGQMASGIAHEINNPLASISGCAESLLRKVESGQYEPQLFNSYLKIILEEILRCKNITTSMLSFVRVAPHVRNQINLNEVISKTLEIIGFQGRLKEVEVINTYAEDPLIAEVNEAEIRQALLSLISNALDAMENRGTLTIVTGAAAGAIFIEISDTGPGIPLDNRNRIFDPFFTTKSDKGGTGLGLPIAKKIIINHQGDLTVTSEKGKGTTFRIQLSA